MWEILDAHLMINDSRLVFHRRIFTPVLSNTIIKPSLRKIIFKYNAYPSEHPRGNIVILHDCSIMIVVPNEDSEAVKKKLDNELLKIKNRIPTLITVVSNRNTTNAVFYSCSESTSTIIIDNLTTSNQISSVMNVLAEQYPEQTFDAEDITTTINLLMSVRVEATDVADEYLQTLHQPPKPALFNRSRLA